MFLRKTREGKKNAVSAAHQFQETHVRKRIEYIAESQHARSPRSRIDISKCQAKVRVHLTSVLIRVRGMIEAHLSQRSEFGVRLDPGVLRQELSILGNARMIREHQSNRIESS